MCIINSFNEYSVTVRFIINSFNEYSVKVRFIITSFNEYSVTFLSAYRKKMCLTFDHQHVHVDRADRGLVESLPLLEHRRNVSNVNVLVGSLSEGQQFPNSHSCNWKKSIAMLLIQVFRLNAA